MLLPASGERITLCTAGPRKGQNSEFEVWFLLNTYSFCTIVKSKNHGKPSQIGDRLYFLHYSSKHSL